MSEPRTEAGPQTRAGKDFLHEWSVGGIYRAADKAYARQSILAIEREAAAPQPLDWNLVTEAVARTMPDSDTFAAPEAVADEYARLSRKEPSDA